MPAKVTEITVQFKDVPHQLFPSQERRGEDGGSDGAPRANFLSLCIQPDEGVHLRIEAKVPGQRMRMRSVEMEFHFGDEFGKAALPDAYERLILDAIAGDASLFARADEIEQSWEIIDPIQAGWDKGTRPLIGDWEADQLRRRSSSTNRAPGAPWAATSCSAGPGGTGGWVATGNTKNRPARTNKTRPEDRTTGASVEVVVLSDASAVAREAAERVISAAHRAVAARGAFALVLSGGSTPADALPASRIAGQPRPPRLVPHGDLLRRRALCPAGSRVEQLRHGPPHAHRPMWRFRLRTSTACAGELPPADAAAAYASDDPAGARSP